MKILEKYRNVHQGETVVVMGNGPSLDKTPLTELQKKYLMFGSNMIFRKPFTPDYYCIVDEEMLASCLSVMPKGLNSTMFIRAEAGIGNPIYPVVANGFSTDISNFIVIGGTVTYALLQIAFYMGAGTVLLVGVDHNYPGTGNLHGKFKAGIYDTDHFQPADGKPYFLRGHTFNAPELEGTARNYAIAEELFRKAGRRIINLTPDTKLDVFEKGTFEQWK